MKVDKDKFDSLLQRLLKQKREKTQAMKGSAAPKPREPIVPKPRPSEPDKARHIPNPEPPTGSPAAFRAAA
jgi:hypothetical protein